MSRVIRSLIVTTVLVAVAFLAMFAWNAWLQSMLPSLAATLSYPGAYEEFAFVLLSGPVLILFGGLAFWLYEPHHRTFWAILFAASLGALLSWTAPAAALPGTALLLTTYRAGVGALTMLLVILGSWLAAKVLRSYHMRGEKHAA